MKLPEIGVDVRLSPVAWVGAVKSEVAIMTIYVGTTRLSRNK